MESPKANSPSQAGKSPSQEGNSPIYKAKKRAAQRKAIRPRRLRVYGLTLEEWEAQEADEEARTFDDFEAVGRSCADYPMADDC
jgi:hypothetical protein